MTERGDTTEHGRPVVALVALGWVGLGFWAIEGGEMWRGAATVLLGVLVGATYLWPRSRFARFADTPIYRRKRPADR